MVEIIPNEFLSFAASVGSRRAGVGGTLLEMTRTATFQNYSCLSAFILLAWDYVDTFADEISLIWSQPSSPSKFVYLFVRYFGLVSQLTNYLIASTRFSHIPISHSACAGWYASEVVTFWALYASSELILMTRVYDLYQHSFRIGLCLVLLHVVETLVVSISCWHTLDSLRFDSICNGVSVPGDVILIVVMIAFSQTVIWTLTFMKRDVKRGKLRTTLMAILGDGQWQWFIILAMLLILVPAAFAFQFALPHLIFSWPATILAVGTCRLLLNMGKRRESEPPTLPWRLELEPELPTEGQSARHQEQQQRKPRKPQYLRLGYEFKSVSQAHTAPSEAHATRYDVPVSPRAPVSSPGHRTTTSYVSSRPGPSLYPTMYGDRTSNSSLSTLTAMTSLYEDSMQNIFRQNGSIEIGSLHAASSSMHSDQMRQFWNDAA